ncbi:MAG: hypothetical protein WA484_09305 [Solirubrobacteraceae bacterium]
MRARAGTLIAAAAITTSFFGGQTLVRHDIGVSGWVAIGCFVLLGFAVLLILWPRRDWEFSLAPDEFIASCLEPVDGDPLEIHLIQRDLALHRATKARSQLPQLVQSRRLDRVVRNIVFGGKRNTLVDSVPFPPRRRDPRALRTEVVGRIRSRP